MTGNAKFDKILMILSLVFTLGSAGLVFYAHNSIKRIPTDQEKEFQDLKDNALTNAQMTPYNIKKIVVNLSSGPSKLRYLEVEMNVLPFDESDKEIIKNGEHLFKNALITIADQLKAEDLGTMTGKILLESKLKKEINQIFGQPLIKQIFFSAFIIQ
jgi:flagellar FliL protein